jgi:hypothetical protein
VKRGQAGKVRGGSQRLHPRVANVVAPQLKRGQTSQVGGGGQRPRPTSPISIELRSSVVRRAR